MTLQPRVVLVHRRSEYAEIIHRYGTRQQAAFVLDGRGRSLDELAERHERLDAARRAAAAAIPTDWRRADLERGGLHRFPFDPEDIVVVVGQDGLVANVAKYLNGQPLIGVNPEPQRNPGVLVPHDPAAIDGLLASVDRGDPDIQRRTMVRATTDDGQQLQALNEIYVGHRSHQSARYRIVAADGSSERQSSSGLLAGTGTGATGWLRSVWGERRSPLTLPQPTEPALCWFVREAWPSIATGTTLTEGWLEPGQVILVQAESDELVCFGDGIEDDALRLTWGQTLTVDAASQQLNLVI